MKAPVIGGHGIAAWNEDVASTFIAFERYKSTLSELGETNCLSNYQLHFCEYLSETPKTKRVRRGTMTAQGGSGFFTRRKSVIDFGISMNLIFYINSEKILTIAKLRTLILLKQLYVLLTWG